MYDHGKKKGTKTPEAETKKEDNNNRKKRNKRKGGQASDSSKNQQTVSVHAATTPTVQTPAATTTTMPTPARPYASPHPKCDKYIFHHTGECKDFQCTNYNWKGHTS